jgi:hypothetical protein
VLIGEDIGGGGVIGKLLGFIVPAVLGSYIEAAASCSSVVLNPPVGYIPDLPGIVFLGRGTANIS